MQKRKQRLVRGDGSVVMKEHRVRLFSMPCDSMYYLIGSTVREFYMMLHVLCIMHRVLCEDRCLTDIRTTGKVI